MKTKLSIMLFSLTLVALGVAGARRSNGFEPASDLPRGALVYVQVENLPDFIKLVTESESFRKFSDSGTMTNFAKSHLGTKLASRLKEMSDAAGFGFDAATLSTLADKRAALALYDIGKLDFAIVAPMSDGVFEATKLAANRGKFAEEKLPDGGRLYRARFRADSGRLAQQLIFTHSRGRLVVTTSDQLLNQTLANIDAKRGRASIADQPSFSALTSDFKPRLAAVWVDQIALNGDYYFKHYWLMSDRKELGNVRAGLFDFGFDETSVSERRVFLTDGTVKARSLDSKSVADALRFVPADVPFYTIETADNAAVDRAVGQTLFDRERNAASVPTPAVSSGQIYGDKYEMAIDEQEEPDALPATESERAISTLFAKAKSVVTFSRPRIEASPLFFETDRAVIITIADARRFDRSAFEKLVAERFAKERSVGAGRFEWRDANGWRALDLPFLGAGARYRVDGANLIVTNGFEPTGGTETGIKEGEFYKLTVVNLGQRETAFDKVFADFERRGADVGFFTSTVGGLLDSAAPAKRIEIRKRLSGKLIEETIVAEK